MPPDPNLAHLRELVDKHQKAETNLHLARQRLDLYVQQLKQEGYSYTTLTKETGLARGTIQNIVAKETG